MKKQQGLTMIEVLIAMVILAIGLLGMESMQVMSLQDTGNSGYRSIGIYLANDMADRIRANKVAMDANNYNSISGASLNSSCLAAAGCSTSAMANHDKQEWLDNLAQSLPGGLGTISRSGDIFTVTVSWTEKVRTAAGVDTGTVTLTFEP
jgi:type IV pilus assembly protein PilV